MLTWTSKPDTAGSECDGLEDICSAAVPTVAPHLELLEDLRFELADLEQRLDAARSSFELARAVVAEDDRCGSVVGSESSVLGALNALDDDRQAVRRKPNPVEIGPGESRIHVAEHRSSNRFRRGGRGRLTIGGKTASER